MKRIKIGLLILFLIGQSKGQNYIEYHKTFNRIDQDVILKNYPLAILRLDSIYSDFSFIYGKHCIKALQICVTANDSIKADKWLEKCFMQGIPIWIVRGNALTNKSLSFSTTQNTMHNFEKLHSIYISSIDTSLSKTIDSLLIIDQKYTRRMNNGFVLLKPFYWLQWGIYNKRQFEQIKQLIEIYGYPEEKRVGLPIAQDSMAFAKYFDYYGPSELRDSRVQIMLQHCYSTWHKIDFDFKNTLYKNLCNGNMPAFQYALIIDFMLPHKRKYIHNKFWLRPEFTDENDATTIEKNRNDIGLNTSEQEQKNRLLERERRKTKQINSEIMPE